MGEPEEPREKKLKEVEERPSRRSPRPSGKPQKLDDANFDDEVSKHDLMLVDFWAPWCGPCRRVAPVVEEIAREYQGRVAVGKLDTDGNQLTAMRFKVLSIPTLILFRRGEPVDQIIGAVPKVQLEAMLNRQLA